MDAGRSCWFVAFSVALLYMASISWTEYTRGRRVEETRKSTSRSSEVSVSDARNINCSWLQNICVVNQSKTDSSLAGIGWSLVFSNDTDVLIGDSVSIKSTHGAIKIQTGGSVTLNATSLLYSGSNEVQIYGHGGVTLLKQANVTADNGRVFMESNTGGQIALTGALVTGRYLRLKCAYCKLTLQANSWLKAHKTRRLVNPKNKSVELSEVHHAEPVTNVDAFVELSGQELDVDPTSGVYAEILNATINTTLTWAGDIEGGVTGPDGQEAIWCDSALIAGGDITLGDKASTTVTWKLRSFYAEAQNIFVMTGTAIAIDQSSSCSNQATSQDDWCISALHGVPIHPLPIHPSNPIHKHDHRRRRVKTRSGDHAPAVSFDMILVANGTVSLPNTTSLSASSLLACADTSLDIEGEIDVSGGGCAPGLGSGVGQTGPPPYNKCGAGGGSNYGAGGRGVVFESNDDDSGSTLKICTLGGLPCSDWITGACHDYPQRPGQEEKLPTQGASGGGCGLHPCTPIMKSPQFTSYGGGLVWLSAPTLTLGGSARIAADGVAGDLFSLSSDSGNPQYAASGGGAGGQILIYTGTIEVLNGGQPTISADGGYGTCTDTVASGAGGGGFIGIRWSSGSTAGSSQLPVQVSVNGGNLSPKCQTQIQGQHNAKAVQGGNGQQTSLAPCDAGYENVFCRACQPGTWNRDGIKCMPCRNMPRTGLKYVGSAWVNDTCQYICPRSSPNVVANPNCYNPVDYALRAFGGLEGILWILFALILAIAAALSRRALARYCKPQRGAGRLDLQTDERDYDDERGVSQDDEGNSSIVGDLATQRWRVNPKPTTTHEVLRPPLSQGRNSTSTPCSPMLGGPPADLLPMESRHSFATRTVFAMNDIPYHVCRLYFRGNNSYASPWTVDYGIPESLEQLLLNKPWESFVRELNQVLEVSRREKTIQMILEAFYIPFAQIYLTRCRRYRANEIIKLVYTVAEAQGGHREPFWKSIRARSYINNAIKFTCDDRAVCGSLDFFDFERSPLDWTPLDPTSPRTRILVAQGDGTFSCPFALDLRDPLVRQLANDFGRSTVQSVVLAFNRMVRLVPPEGPGSSAGLAALQKLKSKVQKCAEMCGQAGHVFVLVLPQLSWPSCTRLHAAGNTADTVTHSEDAINHASTSEEKYASAFGSITSSPTEGCTFESQEVTQVAPMSYHHANGGGLVSLMYPRVTGSRPILGHKICLVFNERAEEDAPWELLQTPVVKGPLTCPAAQESFWAPLSQAPIQVQEPRFKSTYCPWELSLRSAFGALCLLPGFPVRLLARNMSAGSCALSLSIFMVLYCLDAMAIFLHACLTWPSEHNRSGLLVMLLWQGVPPLVVPASLALGLVCLVRESISTGRLYVHFVAFSMLNSIMSFLATIILQGADSSSRGSSLFFDVAWLIFGVTIKCALSTAACVHIANLEEIRDARHIETAQDDFLRMVLDEDRDKDGGSEQPVSAGSTIVPCDYRPSSQDPAAGFTAPMSPPDGGRGISPPKSPMVFGALGFRTTTIPEGGRASKASPF